MLACTLLTAAAVASVAPVYAQSIQGYRHKHWDVAEGAPADIRAIAQTSDGFLWLGTSDGLYRFDGLSFEKVEPATYNRWRSNQVTALAAGRDGALWVGYDYGGVGVYRAGRLVDANTEVKPQGSVSNIAVGPNEDVWVTVNGRLGSELRRLHRGRWRSYTSKDLLRPEYIQSVFVARDGTVWIAQFPSILRIAPGSEQPETITESVGIAVSFTQDEKGVVWLASAEGLQRLTAPRRLYFVKSMGPSAGSVGQRSLLMEQGDAWMAGHQEGMIRLSNLGGTPAWSVVPVRSRFLFRDREGTIWGGGPDGLVNYIRSPVIVSPALAAPRTGFSVPPGRSDLLYFATDDAIYRLAGGEPEIVLSKVPADLVCPGPNAELLIYSQSKFRLREGRRWPVLELRNIKAMPTSCIYQASQRPIASIGTLGTFQLKDGTWQRLHDWPTSQLLVADGPDNVFASQALRAVWQIASGKPRKIWEGDDIAVGFVKLIKQHRGFTYIGGEHGLARYDGREFVTLEARHNPFLSGITGLAIGERETWLIGGSGIARLSTKDFEAAFSMPTRAIPHQAVGADQGLLALSNLHPANDAAFDAAGRPWFVTGRGVVRIDPSLMRPNLVPPPVTIRSLTANGRAYQGNDVSLPAGTSRLQVDYVALSLTDPGRNRYRYQLEGLDQSWVEVGARRQASYTALGPGSYRFRVIAANPDGVWNRTGASVFISIAPFFWETAWFRAAAVLLALTLLWLIVRWRVRLAGDAVRQRVEDRAAVREQIAQDLHDTLLQGVQGLMLRFQAVLSHLPAGHAARAALEATLERADDVLQEGRERVRFLREQSDVVELSPLLSKTAGEVLSDQLPWAINETGTPRPLAVPIAEDIARIAGEAVFNALRHAGASRVAIEIAHERDRVTVAITDDGVGMPAAVRHAGKPGHYGLVGMRERARRLNAALSITDAVPRGTRVSLVVPCKLGKG